MQLISVLVGTWNKDEPRFCRAKESIAACGFCCSNACVGMLLQAGDCGSLSAVEGDDCGGLSTDADYGESDGVSGLDVVESAGLVVGQYVEFGGLDGVECDDVGDGIDAKDFEVIEDVELHPCDSVDKRMEAKAGAEALAGVCMIVKK
ncbi:hypothetical protein OWV82_009216 [Melia azedarach]|uniref:Uncharacterized protein n=1 Tax=Melia azedarach TaxID=155640 RepID=A0ACC1YCM2_MELAZ|nr:hypothetical protein OWV82_009216 [Melia azedarach]